ncbi:sensor domain-containing diguanylate cyclase [Marinobacter changyiensis]|uniref:sensor domain-containing diguanylate cyclase n=1 Tax=Marinobacter changyiensis TaxID=2604091 RepID=UPI0012647CD3|nr:sensor domain-containing diguanylate cyclase [Marinobacter changyiensis]
MHNTKNQRTSPVWRSLWVVLVYLSAGLAWITVSDLAVDYWANDTDLLSEVQTYEGWAFVAVTALVLFFALRRQFRHDRNQMSLQNHQREEIRLLSQFQQKVIDNASIWINVWDPQANVLLWNKAAEKISGYSEQELQGKDQIWQWLYPDEKYRTLIKKTAAEVSAGTREVDDCETCIRTRSGDERLMSWNSRCFYSEAGVLIGSIAIGLDVTDRRIAEARLRHRERQLTTLMDNLPGMAYRCLYDEFWTMKFVSSGCRELTGYEPEAVIDNRDVAFAHLVQEEDNQKTVQLVEEAIGAAEAFSLEYQLVRKDGQVIWVWERGRAVEDGDGLVLEGIILDVTDRKILEQELSELAAHDTLTGLYNRREMNRLLSEEIIRASRYGRHLALLWIDIDHFKLVNDQYGHPAGDAVLTAVCKRLSQGIRSVDAFGRYGGEEFMMLLPEMDGPEAREAADRLRSLVADHTISLEGVADVRLTVSIGIAVFPQHGLTADALNDMADKAMYRAKADGRNQVCLAQASEAESPEPVASDAHQDNAEFK